MAHLWPISTKQLNMFQDGYLYVNKRKLYLAGTQAPTPAHRAGKLVCTTLSKTGAHTAPRAAGLRTSTFLTELRVRLVNSTLEIRPAAPKMPRQHHLLAGQESPAGCSLDLVGAQHNPSHAKARQPRTISSGFTPRLESQRLADWPGVP